MDLAQQAAVVSAVVSPLEQLHKKHRIEDQALSVYFSVETNIVSLFRSREFENSTVVLLGHAVG